MFEDLSHINSFVIASEEEHKRFYHYLKSYLDVHNRPLSNRQICVDRATDRSRFEEMYKEERDTYFEPIYIKLGDKGLAERMERMFERNYGCYSSRRPILHVDVMDRDDEGSVLCFMKLKPQLRIFVHELKNGNREIIYSFGNDYDFPEFNYNILVMENPDGEILRLELPYTYFITTSNRPGFLIREDRRTPGGILQEITLSESEYLPMVKKLDDHLTAMTRSGELKLEYDTDRRFYSSAKSCIEEILR